MSVLGIILPIGRITQTFHDDIATELEKKQQELNDRLKLLTNDNKQFQVTASYLLDLAQRAEMLFKESDDDLRQKLLEYVLSNIELKDKKLSYILNDPFKTIVETKKKSLSAHNSNIWCGYRDSNPGPRPWQGRALTAELHPHTRGYYSCSRSLIQGVIYRRSASIIKFILTKHAFISKLLRRPLIMETG